MALGAEKNGSRVLSVMIDVRIRWDGRYNISLCHCFHFWDTKKSQPEDGLATQDIILSTCRRGSKLHSEGLLSKLEVSSRYRWAQGRMHPRARGLMYWIVSILVRGEIPLCPCFSGISCAFDRSFYLVAYIGVHFNPKDLCYWLVSSLVILAICPFLLKKLVAHWP